MNTCDTCKHWSDFGWFKTGYVGKDGKFVERAVTLTHRDCLNPALCLYFNDDHKGHEFSRLDGVMGHGMRKPATGPKFGCIHWEDKNPESQPAMTQYTFSMDDVYVLRASWEANKPSIHGALTVFGVTGRQKTDRELIQVFLPMLEKMARGIDVVGEYEKMMTIQP